MMNAIHFIVLTFITHLVLFYAIFDVYFTSPLTHNMPVHRSTRSPRAKRLVLIVADGLRADKFFDSLSNTPYFHSIIQNRSSLSGISHTRVPTESRPGHVALISGFYEDISAVTRGWKENPVEFDSVFNRSTYTFGFGSPDIVPMFKRGQSFEHFYVECYDAHDEEFGNDRAHELDLWVERQFRLFLANTTRLRAELKQEKIVFFFHLLGIDTNGHSYKPWSDVYMKNIHIVDGIVERLEMLIEEYYEHDEQTAYLFTSDHGMTDWGSHGAGDDTETLTPMVLWGSGLRLSHHINVNVEQADLCPLMSYLLGLDYPINSVGHLPVDYLMPLTEDLLQAQLENVRQLLEQIHCQYDNLKQRLLFFKPFPNLNEEIFFQRIYHVQNFENLYQIKTEIQDFMRRIAVASHYYHTYRRFLLSLLIIAGFLTSLCTITHQLNPIHPPSTRLGLIFKLFSVLIFLILLIERSPWTHLLYPALVCVHTWLSADFAIDWIRQKSLDKIRSIHFWLSLIAIGIALQTCILPFFYRWTMSLGILLMFIDALRRWQGSFLHDRRRLSYGIFLLLILIFPCLPSLGHIQSTSWCTLSAGVLTLALHYLFFASSESRPSIILRLQRFCLLLAIIDNHLVHHLSIRSSWIHLLSWLIFFISTFLPFFSSTQHRFQRLIIIFTSILTIYILLSTQYEALFLLCLCLLMLTWVIIAEQQQRPIWLFALQSLLFVLLGFFGTGNFASVNSFDPSNVYCFLTIFNPFLMGLLIIFKSILPILVVSCATVMILKNRLLIRDFRLCTLVICDFLALEFFFHVKTNGSWLEIGESISRYVIFMAMIVILSGLHFLATVLLTKKFTTFSK